MIKITSEGSKIYPDIRVHDGEKSFLIKRENAPDPYWIPDCNPFNNNDDITFEVNKSDGEVYKIFEMLYHSIITGNVFPLDETDIQNRSEAEIKMLKRKKHKENKDYQKLAQNTGLVNDNIITWHSEDLDPLESSVVLTIEKHEDRILIIFSKNKKHKDFPNNFPTYAIRISESWSTYREFFCPFVRLHRQLQLFEYEKTEYTSSQTSPPQEPVLSKIKKII